MGLSRFAVQALRRAPMTRQKAVNMAQRSAQAVDVYVETNVLRYFQTAISDPAPPAVRAADPAAARNWVAAMQLFLYAPNRGWQLWVSDTVHEELDVRDRRYKEARWAESLFNNLDAPHGAPPPAAVDSLASTYLERFGRKETTNDRNDMRHLARVVLVGWIQAFVSNDGRLRHDAQRALATDAPGRTVAIYTPVQAVKALQLHPCEQPRRRPAPSNPLWAATWWLPCSTDGQAADDCEADQIE